MSLQQQQPQSPEDEKSAKRMRGPDEDEDNDTKCQVALCERNGQDHLHARELRTALDIIIHHRLEGAPKRNQEDDEEYNISLKCAHRYLLALLHTNHTVVDQTPDKLA